MAPTRSQAAQMQQDQERRILLAITAIKEGRYPSVRQASIDYNVSSTTLRNRLKGVTCRAQTRANCHKLTKNEEDYIVQQVLASVQRGTIPPRTYIRQMANAALSERSTTPTQAVGGNWVSNFVKRRAELQVLYPRRRSRRYIDHPSQSGKATVIEESRGSAQGGRQPDNSSMSMTIQRLTNIEKHASTLREMLGRRSVIALPSARPENFIKGIEMMMQGYIELMEEVEGLQASSISGHGESMLVED